MNAQRITLSLIALGLAAVLIIPATASAKGHRGCGYSACPPVKSCQSTRSYQSGHRPRIIYPSNQGTHAIRGWAPPFQAFDDRRRRLDPYRGSWR
jgi:hypothetical protein